MQANWYCITTNPNCQRRAEAELSQLGYRTFWPKLRKWATHARVRTAKEYPLLGRYMFVEIHGNEFGPVRLVNGVESFVGIAGQPVPMPGRKVEDFLFRYLRGEWDYVTPEPVIYTDKHGVDQVRINERVPVGARIRIMEGEFADMLATVLGRKNGKLRVVPRGQYTEVRVREQNVRAA
jgi:transcription antitermination factor NusG